MLFFEQNGDEMMDFWFIVTVVVCIIIVLYFIVGCFVVYVKFRNHRKQNANENRRANNSYKHTTSSAERHIEYNPTLIKEISDKIDKTPVKSKIDHEKKEITKGSYEYLKKLIEENDEVKLDCDIDYRTSESTPIIELNQNDRVIDGAGHSIYANHAGLFEINADNITLKNIVVKSSSGGLGAGAIRLEKEYRLNIINCRFESCGIAINNGNMNENGGSIYITDSAFTNNVAYGYGGAIHNWGGDLDLNKCIFENNRSEILVMHMRNPLNPDKKGVGGAITHDKGNLILNECIFRNNKSDNFGGAILAKKGNIELNSCVFENNSSNEHGGAISNGGFLANGGEMKLKECCFIQNKSKAGGAITNIGIGRVKLNTCEFEKNMGGIGGAIFNDSILTSIHSTFNQNGSADDGSAIFNSGIVKLFNSTFIDNLSLKGMYTIFQTGGEDSTLTVEYSQFSIDLEQESGGIHIYSGSCMVNKSKFFINNYANDKMLLRNDGVLQIEKSKFEDTVGQKLIYNTNELKILRKDHIEEIINSETELIYIKEKLPIGYKGFTYLESIIRNNLTEADTGDMVEVSLDDDIIIHPSEQDYFEGGIELDADDLTINGNGHTIDGQELTRIFYVTGKNITLKDITFANGKYFKSEFDSSIDYVDEGKIIRNERKDVTLYEGEFLKQVLNTMNDISPDITLKMDLDFISNVSGGGAICALHDSSLKIIDCKFLDNASRNAGGAINTKGDLLDISDSLFENNTAQQSGGAIHNGQGRLNINDCEFNDNITHYDGNVITNNMGLGGAISNEKGNLAFENVTFNRNKARVNGGAICNGAGLLDLEECDFRGNSAFHGGAILNETGDLNLKKCTFNNNAATKITTFNGVGGAIHNVDGKLNKKRCEFNNNTPAD